MTAKTKRKKQQCPYDKAITCYQFDVISCEGCEDDTGERLK